MRHEDVRLAVLGGRPAVTTPEGSAPRWSNFTRAAVAEILGDGPSALSSARATDIVRSFEEAFAEQTGARYAVATASGTTALVAALAAARIGPGDEVIVATYGWGGTAGAVVALGSTPVFADVDPVTYNMDPQSAADRITTRTRAILATHLFGHPARVPELATLAARHGVALLFDGAQALGAKYDGQPVGAFGDVSTFSFGRGKLISAGEGGMVTTNETELYERIVLASQHPIRAFLDVDTASLRAHIDEVSISARIHPIAAAIGLRELPSLAERVALRRATCRHLARALRDVQGFRAPTELPPATHAYHGFAMEYVPDELHDLPVGVVMRALRAEGVPVARGPIGTPIHLRPRFTTPDATPTFAPYRRLCCDFNGSAPVAEARCAGRELLLESTSLWLAVPSERLDELASAFRKVALNAGLLADLRSLVQRKRAPRAGMGHVLKDP